MKGSSGDANGTWIVSRVSIASSCRFTEIRVIATVTLLLMVKSMEENFNYLRVLGVSGEAFNAVEDARMAKQRDILRSGTTSPGPRQRRAYMQQEAQKLRNNLRNLREGLHSSEQQLFERARKEIEAEAARGAR